MYLYVLMYVWWDIYACFELFANQWWMLVHRFFFKLNLLSKVRETDIFRIKWNLQKKYIIFTIRYIKLKVRLDKLILNGIQMVSNRTIFLSYNDKYCLTEICIALVPFVYRLRNVWPPQFVKLKSKFVLLLLLWFRYVPIYRFTLLK